MSSLRASEFLFTNWEGGGNVPPCLATVRRLVERGHRVRVLSDACNAPEIEAAGAEALAWAEAPNRRDKSPASDLLRDWEVTTPVETIERLVERILCGPALAYASDTLAELARRPADALVTSEMLFGAMIAAEAAGVPLAVLTANIPLFPVAGLPPFGPGLPPARSEVERREHAEIAAQIQQAFDRFLPALNSSRAEHALPPLEHLFDQMTRAERVLIGTARAFDFAAEALPRHVRYVGPVLDDPSWVEEWTSPWPDRRAPLVLVALSTTYQAQASALQRILDALAVLPVRALVTLGPALDAAAFRAAPNTMVCRSAPHSRVLQQAALAVVHAGHGTTIRALAAGVPLLCLPMGRDQNENATRVETHGAGLQLPQDAPVDAIRAALQRLLDEPGFRSAAGALGKRIVAEADASPLLEELEALARRERRPLAA